jgi:hypothetical protein
MRDYIILGSSPSEESCIQVGANDYEYRAQAECRRFIRVIRDVVGPEPDGARLAVKANRHDLGTYYEVVCWYDDPYSESYALRCEEHAPTKWPV